MTGLRKPKPPKIRYARVEEVKAGTVLITDGGFTCMPANARRTVASCEHGDLFVACRDGGHYLDSQLENGEYIGLTLAE